MSLSCGVNASPAVRTTAGPLSSRPTPAAVVAHPAAASAFQRVESAVSSAHEADERARAAERGALGALESFSQRLGRVEGTSSQGQNQLQSVEGRVDTLAAAVDAAGSRGQGHGGGEARAGGQGGGGGEGGALAAEVARLRDLIAEKDSADQAALENEKKASADPRATPLWSAMRCGSLRLALTVAHLHAREQKAAILFAEVSRLGKMVEGAASRMEATERESRARVERAEAAAEAAQQEASRAHEASSVRVWPLCLWGP